MGTLTPPRCGGTFGRHSASLHVAEPGRGRVPAAPLISRNAGGARPGPGAGGASLRVPRGRPSPGPGAAEVLGPAPRPRHQTPAPSPPSLLHSPALCGLQTLRPHRGKRGVRAPHSAGQLSRGAARRPAAAPRPAGRAQPRPARGRPRPAPSGARAAAAANLLFHPPARIPARRRLTTNCTIDCLNIFHLDKISLG